MNKSANPFGSSRILAFTARSKEELEHHEFSGSLWRHLTEVLAVEGPKFVGGGFFSAIDVQSVVDGPALQPQICHPLENLQILAPLEADDLLSRLRDVLLYEAPGLSGRDCRDQYRSVQNSSHQRNASERGNQKLVEGRRGGSLSVEPGVLSGPLAAARSNLFDHVEILFGQATGVDQQLAFSLEGRFLSLWLERNRHFGSSFSFNADFERTA